MILSFELTMPNVGSWNGKWTGASKAYFKHRTVTADKGNEVLRHEAITPRTFHYSFGDGWGANVTVERVTAAEKRRREKISAGFCGYDWMIHSILEFGKILNDAQQEGARHKRSAEQVVANLNAVGFQVELKQRE